jgi:rhamnulokinase
MQVFNSIYQLYALKTQGGVLERAKSFLMVPEYFNFLLTGVKMNEYTNATTTQLVSAATGEWDTELMRALGIDPCLFGELHMPKTLVGRLSQAVKNEVGFDCDVVLPATHDTGSAVLSVPAEGDDYIYLSSGTWSLIGTERMSPDCGDKSFERNFTNEGGCDRRFRHLKNIMGLWIIQSVRRELGGKYTFDDLCDLAQKATGFKTVVNVNDPGFLSPDSMTGAIKGYCMKNGLAAPATVGELAACVYNSLAESYGEAVREIAQITGKKYKTLHIVGGGTKDVYLNALAAKYTGLEVYAGPTEATAVGNVLAQMLRTGEFPSLQEARRAVARSFNIKKIEV